MNVRNWKKVVQNRDCWKNVVEQARTLYRLWCSIRRKLVLLWKQLCLGEIKHTKATQTAGFIEVLLEKKRGIF